MSISDNSNTQIDLLDSAIRDVQSWANGLHSTGKVLSSSKSTVEDIDGMPVYLGCPFERFVDDLAIVLNSQYHPHMPFGTISNHIPNPMSPRLEKLEQRLARLTNCANLLQHNEDFKNNIIAWESSDGTDVDPAIYANTLGDQLIVFSKSIYDEILPQLLHLKREWKNEVARLLDKQAYDDERKSAFIPDVYNINKQLKSGNNILTFTNKAIDKLKATINRGLIPELNTIIKLLKLCKSDLEKVEADQFDIESVSKAIEGINDILSKEYPDTIASWKNLAMQKSDSVIVLDALRGYWQKKNVNLQETRTKSIEEHKQKPSTVILPSYRFKLGDMVKSSDKRNGRVIGMRRDSKSNRPLYKVVFNDGSTREFHTTDIKRLDK